MKTQVDDLAISEHVALTLSGARMVRLSKQVVPETFQVLGERCSGTNFVRVLVAQNLALRPEGIQPWKHGFPTFAAVPRRVVFFAIFRNALDWLRSLYTKPWHSAAPLRALPFTRFIRAEWRGVVDWPGHFHLPEADGYKNRILQHDLHPITGQPFENLIALRTAKAQGLLGLERREVNVVFAPYEAIVAEPEAFVEQVAAHYGIPRQGSLRLPERWLGEAGALREAPVERPPRGLDPNDRRFVVASLDRGVEARIGYRYAAPDRGLRGIFTR